MFICIYLIQKGGKISPRYWKLFLHNYTMSNMAGNNQKSILHILPVASDQCQTFTVSVKIFSTYLELTMI